MSAESRFEYKLVVAVRTDLKLSPGKLAVQVAHAAVGCSVIAREKDRKTFEAWLSEGQKKVVVKVRTAEDLFLLKDSARRRGLVSSLIADAGLTEIPPGTVTCLGIGPAKNVDVDPITGDLALM